LLVIDHESRLEKLIIMHGPDQYRHDIPYLTPMTMRILY
jgi:hypothetical protein